MEDGKKFKLKVLNGQVLQGLQVTISVINTKFQLFHAVLPCRVYKHEYEKCYLDFFFKHKLDNQKIWKKFGYGEAIFHFNFFFSDFQKLG